LGELIFVGLGLHDEKGISLRGLREAREADSVFAEFYTNLMPDLSVRELEKLVGREIFILSRRHLEEEGGQKILRVAIKGKAVLFVPGDPLIATTHIDLRIRAEKRGIKTRIIHAASIISAIIGLSGLQNYKFGRSVTIPLPEEGVTSKIPYVVIFENKKRGLHTLCFLDFKAERHMTLTEGLGALLEMEREWRRQVINPATLAIGVARAGSRNPVVKAGYVKEIMGYNFGSPPYTLVFPGRLHFMEAEALITLAKAPEKIKELVE